MAALRSKPLRVQNPQHAFHSVVCSYCVPLGNFPINHLDLNCPILTDLQQEVTHLCGIQLEHRKENYWSNNSPSLSYSLVYLQLQPVNILNGLRLASQKTTIGFYPRELLYKNISLVPSNFHSTRTMKLRRSLSPERLSVFSKL